MPQIFRTNVATTGNLAIGPEFLALNKNVNESGLRGFWSLHMAYYYRHLSLVGEWQSGFDSYALANQSYRTRVPVESFYMMAGYFLTGETVSSRGVLKPLHNFDVRPGKSAWVRSSWLDDTTISISAARFSRPDWPTPASGPTRSIPSTPGSTGTGRSTSRCTLGGNTPGSATTFYFPGAFSFDQRSVLDAVSGLLLDNAGAAAQVVGDALATVRTF